MMEVTDCAILLWLSITTLIIVAKIDAANINSRELNNKEKHLVNVTRHYEGDIIFIKGKRSKSEVQSKAITYALLNLFHLHVS
jgi:hypothetical protein